MLVGRDVAVEGRVGDVVIAKIGKIHWHRIPTFARDAGNLSAVEVGLEAAAVANIDHLVGDVEGKLAG